MSGAVQRKEEGHGRMELLFGAFVVSSFLLFKIKYDKVIKMHGHFQKRGERRKNGPDDEEPGQPQEITTIHLYGT